jgi:DNA-binding MarR family transcriptional regulator
MIRSLRSAALTGILDRLEAMEIIERKANPDDRRSVIICLTSQGGEIAGKIRNLVNEANREFLQNLSKEEEAMLKGLLKRLRLR